MERKYIQIYFQRIERICMTSQKTGIWRGVDKVVRETGLEYKHSEVAQLLDLLTMWGKLCKRILKRRSQRVEY